MAVWPGDLFWLIGQPNSWLLCGEEWQQACLSL